MRRQPLNAVDRFYRWWHRQPLTASRSPIDKPAIRALLMRVDGDEAELTEIALRYLAAGGRSIEGLVRSWSKHSRPRKEGGRR